MLPSQLIKETKDCKYCNNTGLVKRLMSLSCPPPGGWPMIDDRCRCGRQVPGYQTWREAVEMISQVFNGSCRWSFQYTVDCDYGGWRLVEGGIYAFKSPDGKYATKEAALDAANDELRKLYGI